MPSLSGASLRLLGAYIRYGWPSARADRAQIPYSGGMIDSDAFLHDR